MNILSAQDRADVEYDIARTRELLDSLENCDPDLVLDFKRYVSHLDLLREEVRALEALL